MRTGPDHVLYRSSHVGELSTPFVSDAGLPGFSDGEMIPGGGMILMSGAVGEAGGDRGLPAKQAFFSLDLAVPMFCISFATGKRAKAFYSAKENDPIGVNPAEWAFFQKRGRKGVVLASNSGNEVSGGAIRGHSGAGLGGGGEGIMDSHERSG